MPTKINAMNLQACHRLQSRSANKPTIIKIVNRKHAEQAIANKFKLKRLDFNQIGFPKGSNIYIDMKCCKRIKHLSYHCRKLRADKLIHKFFANANGSIRITIGSDHHKIFTESDLASLFPERNFGFTLPYLLE